MDNNRISLKCLGGQKTRSVFETLCVFPTCISRSNLVNCDMMRLVPFSAYFLDLKAKMPFSTYNIQYSSKRPPYGNLF